MRFAIPFLFLVSAAGAAPRDEIARNYYRSSQAMSLKFVDGVHSIRGRNFQLTDPDSVRVSEAIERSRLQTLLSRALQVEETNQINQFELLGQSARCRVHFHTRLRLVDEQTNKPYDMVIETDCQDDWVQEREGWKMQKSRVLFQDWKRLKL